VFTQAVVYSGDEPGPQPGVVFGGEVRGVVWEFFLRWRCDEDFGWIVVEYGEQLGAVVGWKVQRGRAGVED
jgi:hypothetical protein